MGVVGRIQYKLITTSNSSLNKTDTCIYFAKVRMAESPTDLSFYNGTFVGAFNYITGSINEVNITFPKDYILDNGSYSFNSYPNVSLFKEDIIYSFPFSSAIFRYKEGRNQKIIPCNEPEIKFNPISHSSLNNVGENGFYMATSPYFKAVISDTNRNLYYQIQNLKKDSWEEDVKFKIIVRDSEFKKRFEFDAPENLFPSHFIYSGGLAFRLKDAERSDGFMKIIVYNFDKISN